MRTSSALQRTSAPRSLPARTRFRQSSSIAAVRVRKSGAGGGNRTRDSCLEGKGITIMQRPRGPRRAGGTLPGPPPIPSRPPARLARLARRAGLPADDRIVPQGRLRPEPSRKQKARIVDWRCALLCWWAGLDSNQRTALSGPGLQPGAFNHSTTYPRGEVDRLQYEPRRTRSYPLPRASTYTLGICVAGRRGTAATAQVL
jgi:hypothetical protein